MGKKRIIVDSDAGLDDALALLMFAGAHKLSKIELLAVTCVNGNTIVDNVVNNVFRTLQTCDLGDIPVYKGAYSAFLSTENARICAAELYHGGDGFGDAFEDKPDISKLQKEHAVHALNSIVSENPGQVSIVCLGPLTNIALAIKLYPDFIENVKEFFIMGGNYTARGNITSQAEFNFYSDPESVHIFLANNNKPHLLLPWETCLKSTLSIKWRIQAFPKIKTPQVKLMTTIEKDEYLVDKRSDDMYGPCDAILAAIVLRPDMARDVIKYHADIELTGLKTRGQVLIDHLRSKDPNVDIVTGFDSGILKEMVLFAADPDKYQGNIP